MPRKPVIHPRGLTPASSTGRGTLTPGRIYQCQACGGLIDPLYVHGGDSWCPDCKERTYVAVADGHIPSPSRYGDWLREHDDTADPLSPSAAPLSPAPAAPAPAPVTSFTLPALPDFKSIFAPLNKGLSMKTLRAHTGIFSCLHCCTEFDLFAETNLKCDSCGQLLIQGRLQELTDQVDDEQDPEDQ